VHSVREGTMALRGRPHPMARHDHCDTVMDIVQGSSRPGARRGRVGWD
jgi:hypothetical protein